MNTTDLSAAAKSAERQLISGGKTYHFFDLNELDRAGIANTKRLPYSIKVLLESALRNYDAFQVTDKDVERLASWTSKEAGSADIAFKPARVVLQDFTGVPAVVDLAAMRAAMKRIGGDINKINPQVLCDLVIDHSIQVDSFGTADSLSENLSKEFERNQERYEFLKWGQKTFRNFRVVPPATGIVHQVNLEYLASGVLVKETADGKSTVYPDSLVGTDSHTTMINGIGVAGWGVGGIEAEAVMLGEPIYMVMPEVVGFELKGSLREGVTATDMVLVIVEQLRKKGVVGKFVEFYGDGLKNISVPDRATIANMAPEYGATMGFFPVDSRTLDFYRITAREEGLIDLIEKVSKEQGLFYDPEVNKPEYTDVLSLDLSEVQPCLAGPKRPQDRINLGDMKKSFQKLLTDAPYQFDSAEIAKSVQTAKNHTLHHGDVVIAAITSCTNTSNPSVMVAAGLLAKKAVEKGLTTKSHVKTSLAPGSGVVTEYLKTSGVLPYLEKLGFYVVGYGCTTCIGNSGPLPEDIAKTITDERLVVSSVLSGNRNFEGRINPHVKANYLASPPLVVAYAIAGTASIDLNTEPLGQDSSGKDVFLKDVWPSNREILDALEKSLTAESFRSRYSNVFAGTPEWQKVHEVQSDLFEWKESSTYIQEPPFFADLKDAPEPIKAIKGARALAVLGDSVTTDHISPAGSINADSPAGKYLSSQGVSKDEFNSYGSRRGNDRVMTRGTFANIRLRNQLVPGSEGSATVYFPTGEKTSIYEASEKYIESGIPLCILAGKEYGTGSSRDWAAKGTRLLGVKFVIAESYERIHRSNLIGMGVLPLQFKDGDTRESLGLTGTETFELPDLDDHVKPGQTLSVNAVSEDGSKKSFSVVTRIDTPVEVEYYRNGGILQTVLRKLSK